MDEHEETRPRRVSNGTQDLAPVGAVVDRVVLVARSTFCRRFDNVAPPMSCGVLLQMVRNSRASGCVVFGEWSVCCTRGCREGTVAMFNRMHYFWGCGRRQRRHSPLVEARPGVRTIVDMRAHRNSSGMD